MTKLYAIRIETDDCHYTYGYVTDLTRAELEVNCWKRWAEALDAQWDRAVAMDQSDEIKAIVTRKWTLFNNIVASCRIEAVRLLLLGDNDWDLQAFLANIRIVEVPIGIIWPENPGIRVGEVGVRS